MNTGSAPQRSQRLQRFCQRFCVGLTGGIASGKSTATETFAQLGAGIVDTDVIAHQLTAGHDSNTGLGAAMPAIEHTFGASFINANGSLNRAAMRAHVFANPLEKRKLEAILHPMINETTRQQAAVVVGAYVLFVVPLLAESAQWRTQVDRFAVVDCDPQLQRQRLLLRPGLSEVQADQILAAQASREARLNAADDTLYNNGDKTALIQAVTALHMHYLSLS